MIAGMNEWTVFTGWRRLAFAVILMLAALNLAPPHAVGQSAQPQNSQTQNSQPQNSQDTQLSPAPNGQQPNGQAQNLPAGTNATNGQPAPAPQPSAPPAAPRPLDDALFPQPLRETIARLNAEIERLAKSVDRVREQDEDLEKLRPQIEEIERRSEQADVELAPLIEKVKRQLSALGEKPKDGEPGETEQVAAERARLSKALSELEGAIKQNELTRVRARQLLGRIQALRLENLGRNLQRRETPPTVAAHWLQLADKLPRFGQQIVTVTENWWGAARDGLHWLFLIVAGGAAAWWYLRWFAARRIHQWLAVPLEDGPPAFLKRVRLAVSSLPLLLAPSLFAFALIYFGMSAAGLLNNQMEQIALSGLKALALFLVVRALAKTILMPWSPTWRLIGLSTRVAERFVWLISLLAGVYCLDLWLNELYAAIYAPEPIRLTTMLLANLAFAGLLLAFTWSRTNDAQAEDESSRVGAQLVHQGFMWLRLPATLAVVGIFATSMLGYFALGRFIAGQVMLLGTVAAALLLGLMMVRSLTLDAQSTAANATATPFGQWRQFINATVSFLVTVSLLIAASSFVLLTWGFSAAEMMGWGRSLLFGFEIGNFRFSLVQIIAALVLFFSVIALTRLLQGWLARKVFNPERMDRGIANSVHAGIGYLGVALAALIGVSYAGVDLSNVALIASALSIGIGFGLNAIASNFVSGLIMLIERPIKVGDWVVVGEYQGHVRHISVRATEIETFDRASVIIPNSDFMTSAVQNWTHRNAMARVVVPIGVSYNADPRRVIALLQQVADDCELLLKYPAPTVHFEEFGASSLDFVIRAYIADVNTGLSARTALRLGIVEAFKAENIEIPFPQQDVHLRDLDTVRDMAREAMARRAAGVNGSTVQQSDASSTSSATETGKS